MIRHASKRLVTACAAELSAASPLAAISPISSAAAATATRSFSSTSAAQKEYEHVLVERRFSEDNPDKCGVGLITLNRPKALNALCDALFDDLIDAASTFDREDDIGCMVITGSSKAFAAGADISEMSQREFSYAYKAVST
jgi:enoyl-CoA hydratase